jgi:hypothetical protein
MYDEHAVPFKITTKRGLIDCTVSFEALEKLSGGTVDSQAVATEVYSHHKDRVGAAARAKYDRGEFTILVPVLDSDL